MGEAPNLRCSGIADRLIRTSFLAVGTFDSFLVWRIDSRSSQLAGAGKAQCHADVADKEMTRPDSCSWGC